MPRKIMFTDQQTSEIIELYNNNWSCAKIGRKFGCMKGPINNLLQENNITIKPCHYYKRKYTINEDIFDVIDTHEKAYWLGMLSGDGHINDEKISLSLKISDRDHIEKFRTFLQSEHKIYETVSKKNNNCYKSAILTIYSKKLSISISKLIPINNKTENLVFPDIPKKFHCSFILGMIDADGSFKIPSKQRYSKITKRPLSIQACVSLASTYSFMEKYKEIMQDACSLNVVKTQQSSQTKFLYAVEYGGNKQFVKIIKYLYAFSPIWLPRKKDKALQHLNKVYPDNSIFS